MSSNVTPLMVFATHASHGLARKPYRRSESKCSQPLSSPAAADDPVIPGSGVRTQSGPAEVTGLDFERHHRGHHYDQERAAKWISSSQSKAVRSCASDKGQGDVTGTSAVPGRVTRASFFSARIVSVGRLIQASKTSQSLAGMVTIGGEHVGLVVRPLRAPCGARSHSGWCGTVRLKAAA